MWDFVDWLGNAELSYNSERHGSNSHGVLYLDY